ncbi:aquaporin [Dactylosporangium sp. NBC_01737]|uniref:aquaporin n=1 Tax=Dactylosporangium sp. NBC_01737 TaxID=2975959 RepID=UPI002E1094F5|nr:aquaporin [Dactylosporangium sp. NBC_01737]
MNTELSSDSGVPWRRFLAEFVGTALLVTAVVGSGVMATTLSPGDVGLQLLQNSVATAFALGALILTFGPVSGAHLNPVVSAADWFLGRRTGTGLPARDLCGYVVAQTVGAIGGAVLANLMFDLPAVELSGKDRSAGHLWLGEVVATAGLVLLVFALARSGRAAAAPAAVGAYIGAAYWFTSSTSFANPAVTAGRAFTDTFAGIAPASVPGFVVAQLLGLAVGVGLLLALYPGPPAPRTRRSPAPMTEKPSVLFVCVHNAGRSQMAAGWLRHLAGDTVEVRSAGSEPASQLNPVVVEAMREVGIDITASTPRKLDYQTAEASDVLITMGCGDVCPVFPGKRYVDWKLDDPAGQDIEAVRPIRDAIKARVEQLLTELPVTTG